MIRVQLTEDMRQIAKKKAEEIPKLKNSILKGKGNYCGFLGELAVLEVMKNAEWMNDGENSNSNEKYSYDIKFWGLSVDVKSKTSATPPNDSFEVSVTTGSLAQDADIFAFVTVTDNHNTAYISGWLSKEDYIKKAYSLKKGTVHGKEG